MSAQEVTTHEWDDGWATRRGVAADLVTLRDCDTCVPFTTEQREHIDTLISLYTPNDDDA